MRKRHTPRDLPRPDHAQPHRAGDIETFPTGKVTYLAPRPLPTGMPAVDFHQSIGEMNDAWLDYGAGGSNVFGWQLVLGGPIGIFLIWVVIFPLVTLSSMDWDFYQKSVVVGLLGGGALFLLAYSAARKVRRDLKQAIPIRFHRQRREVCFIVKDTHEVVIVPWESLMAWVVQARGGSQYGATRQYGLGIGYAHPKTGQWLKLEFTTPGLPLALGEWEALRAYMEYEVNARDEIQDPFGLRSPGDPPWEGVHTIRNAHRKLHERRRQDKSGLTYLYLPFWYLYHALTLWTLPGYLAERETRRIQRARPQLHLPEVEAWSKPLPREQWAKPSEALVKLSAEVRRIRQRDPLRPIEEIVAEAYRRQGVVA